MTTIELKRDLVAFLNDIPSDAPFERVLEEISTFLDVAAGEHDIQAGRVIAHEEVLRHFASK